MTPQKATVFHSLCVYDSRPEHVLNVPKAHDVDIFFPQ